MVKVLFIDDNPQEHKTLAHVLPEPYRLLSAYTGREGIDIAEREGPDVVLLDIGLPDMDGIAVLKLILSRPLPPPVVMLTALSDTRLVKEAIQAGARDYIVKPFAMKELLGTLRTSACGEHARRRTAEAVGQSLLEQLIGESAAMREVKHLILRYGPSDSPILIMGESGTGKELVARSIHSVSRRGGCPCVAINCGALPESLLETELFGSEKGAFTDAVARPGSFEQANGGTLFLDEIGEMSATAQTRLLRVLEQKELTRVGGHRAVPLDVRVVSATNRELKKEVSRGRFREDLFYRLNVLPIRVPPLRDRSEDIPVLAAHLLSLMGKSQTRIDSEARDKLSAHPWPGNIRELRNVLERAALGADGGTIRARNIHFD